MRIPALVSIVLLLISPPVPGAGPVLPEALQSAGPNTWVRIDTGGIGKRTSPGLVWAPDEGRFICFGGAMQMLAKHNAPYTEMTLDLAAGRWLNRFPKGTDGVWGDSTGPSKAPQFAGSYYAVRMADKEGNVRPYLGSGYDRGMYLWDNFAFDSDRKVVVVFWHFGAVTAEYDPAARTWRIVKDASPASAEFLDDFLWGAMCYDPVNKEVLGGRGRWAYSAKSGKWRKLTFADKLLAGPHAEAEKLRLRAKDLLGAARSRYYQSETPTEAKLDLRAMARAIHADAGLLSKKLVAGRRAGKRAVWAEAVLCHGRWEMPRAAEGLADVSAETIADLTASHEWLAQTVTCLSSAPPPRAWSPMVYDPKAKRIVMFGGHRTDRLLADTWVYDCAARTWQLRRPKLSPSPRAGHGLTWLPEAGKVLLIDGIGIKGGQMWVYDTAANEWSLLAEGDAKRPRLTGRGSYGYLPAPAAAAPGDVVVTTSHKERGGVTTWAAKIDAARVDAEGTKKFGVGFLIMSTPTGATNPRWYERTGPAPDPAEGKKLDSLPPNTWVRITPPNNSRFNRAWGTTVYDAARDQLLQWDGGHAAYCGNDVLHYSIRTNRCSIGSYLPEFALNWNASMLGPPSSQTFAGRPHQAHGYKHYGFDPPTGKLISFSQKSGSRWFVYDPHTRDWKGAFGPPVSRKLKGAHNFTCTPHPRGLLVWASPKLIWQLEGKTMTWRKLPLKGALPRMRVDCHGMAYDSKRERLLMFSMYLKGDVVAYDLASGQAKPLGPAGGRHLASYIREALYVPHADVVLAGTRSPLPGGKMGWTLYDCAKNAWVAARLAGDGPIKRPAGRHGVGLGFSYDARRKLVWAVGARLTIHALRLDMQTAEVQAFAADRG